MADPTDPAALARELETAHGAFLVVVGSLSDRRLRAPRLIGDWGLRELLAHLGYWAGNAAEALHWAEQGRADEFGRDALTVDERNEVVARVAGETDLATARAREEAAFGALLDRVRRADSASLAATTAAGETGGSRTRDDGAEHYREHAAELRVATEDVQA